jgi:hypothetical protein
MNHGIYLVKPIPRVRFFGKNEKEMIINDSSKNARMVVIEECQLNADF